jgi:PilZ domain-containing protein
VADENDKQIFVIEHRRSPRVLVNVSVEVTFETDDGRQVTERTFIEDVSDLGCRFSTNAPAHQGDLVSLRLLGPRSKAVSDEAPRHYRIMWVAPHGHGSTVGARLIDGEKPVEVDTVQASSTQPHHSE